MQRRHFLILTGLSATGILVAPALYLITPDVKNIASQMIKREFDFLKFASGAINSYVDDYFNIMGNNLVLSAKWKTFDILDLSWENSNQVRDLLKYFLLSTDFFIHKMNENRTVTYMGLYNPYTSPLSNPYSFILYPPEEVKSG